MSGQGYSHVQAGSQRQVSTTIIHQHKSYTDINEPIPINVIFEKSKG